MKQRKSSKKTLTQRVNTLEKELCSLKKIKQVKAFNLPEPKAGMVFRNYQFGTVYVIISNHQTCTHRLEDVENSRTWNGNILNKKQGICSREIYGDQGEDRLIYLGMLSEFTKIPKPVESKKGSYTFDEWKKRGRHIKPGERHTDRNEDGDATFTWDQTESSASRRARLEELEDFQSDLEGMRHEIF